MDCPAVAGLGLVANEAEGAATTLNVVKVETLCSTVELVEL